MGVFERHALSERPAGPDGADAARAVGLLLRHARGGLALRDRGDERDRPLRRAHVLQGDRAAADRARHRRRDRRDRRRVQRLHRQGVHGLLRPLRRRDARHRARRARRHAPQLPLRRRGDRAREGRDHRGDEHVLRHAARLHRRRLRDAPLRRPAARLGHHRPQGDGPRRDARDVPRLHEHLVPARPAWSSASAASIGDGLHERLEELLGDLAARGDGLAAAPGSRPRTGRGQGAHEAVGPGAPRPRRPQPPARSTPTATCSSCWRPCSAAACRRASSPRCASGAGSPTTSSARTTPTPTRARSTRSRASTSTGSTTR